MGLWDTCIECVDHNFEGLNSLKASGCTPTMTVHSCGMLWFALGYGVL